MYLHDNRNNRRDKKMDEIKISKEELVDLILESEWNMFTSVLNVGGRASCQDDPETFEIMRRSQFEAWNELLLESYLADILNASFENRNLLAEKYGYMMKYSFPQEYEAVKDELPEISEEKLRLVKAITEMHLDCRKEEIEKYPRLFGKGRPERITDEVPGFVSVESYTLGELSTMSERSLKIYYDYMLELKENGVNIAILILENTVKKYGYDSLEKAETK